MTAAQRRCGLVVRQLFETGNPAQPANAEVIESERRNLCDVTGFDICYVHFDKMAHDDPLTCHIKFLEKVAEIRPEFIYVHPHVFLDTMHFNVRVEILYAARLLYGPRLIFSFADLGYAFQTSLIAGYAAIGDISASWDGNGAELAKRVPGRTVLDLWAPRNGRLFRDLGIERDIDVGFIGKLHHYEDRRAAIVEARKIGAPIEVHGSDETGFVSDEDYVQFLNRSKITLNFSKTTAGAHQLKGRVIESILCGALLFESENEVTPRYLTPYRHYVPFTDPTDLAAKIRRYLGNDAARRAIVTAARAHVMENLSYRAWWRRVIGELDRQWMELLAQKQGTTSA